jgi:putative aldouronate transport system substrate-binding protein
MTREFLTCSLATALLGLVITLSGCSGAGADASVPNDSGEGGATSLEPVTLEIVIPGAKAANINEVLAEVNKRLQAEINTQVKFTVVDFADLNQKTNVMLASGERVDLIFDAPWLRLRTSTCSLFLRHMACIFRFFRLLERLEHRFHYFGQ